MRNYFELALDNIITYGDTDIFPFPMENIIFFDNKEEVLDLLEKIHSDYDNYICTIPPIHESMLVPSGYNGFRWATQLDPVWNAYYLGLVLSIATKIEKLRIAKDKEMVFSYRIKTDKKSKMLFDPHYGWQRFQTKSIEKAETFKYVLICDISHFYSNIYHHRLENALNKLNANQIAVNNIMNFLQNFSNIKSYGLPVGGQASRILAELLLDKTDKLLKSHGIEFCRFVDDYHIFANSEEELYEHLLYLSKILIENEGLSLQRSKTRILKSEEFINNSTLLLENSDGKGESRHKLFSISYKYDPYSQTADEDYEKIKEEIEKLNIVGVLSEELNKSRVHSALIKKLIGAIKYLDKDLQNDAVISLVDNLDVLAPVFSNVMIVINNLFKNLSDNNKDKVVSILFEKIKNNSYLMKVELNLSYSIRVISNHHSEENEDLLIKVYNSTNSNMIRRDIILILAKWNADYWLSDLKNKYSAIDAWQKRSFIIASYYLGDEGKHWRDHKVSTFSELEILYRNWICKKNTQSNKWSLPI